jgi:hypothetical protein
MSNALTLSQHGMWAEVHADAIDMWQIIARHVELTKKINDCPPLAELLAEAMMARDDGIGPGPFIAARDVLHMARQRAAEHQRQQAEQPRHGENAAANGHGQPTAQFTAAPAQVTQ